MTLADFSNRHFDPEATEAMGRAFESACKLKPKASRELIANRIIELAKTGKRHAQELCAIVIDEFNPR